MVSHAIPSLSFRVLWAFPFVLFLGLDLVAAARQEMRLWRLPVLSLALLASFLLADRWITAATNLNHFGDAGYKILPEVRQWLDSGSDIRPKLPY